MARQQKREAPGDAVDTPASKRVRQQDESTPTEYPASIEGSVAYSTFTSTSTKRPKKYVCEFESCGKAFDRPVKLEAHVRTHTNERPYTCEEEHCGKTFQRKEHLTRHIKDKHSDERPHVCSYVDTDEQGEPVTCVKAFHTAAKLKRHVAAHEEKEQTRCSEPGCGKLFRKQETLQRHILQDHLGEKAFRCTHITNETEEECGQAFETVGHLKGHIKRHHASFVIRHFCDLCGTEDSQSSPAPILSDSDIVSIMSEAGRVGFASYADLQTHIKVVHPPSCPDCGKQCESNRALKAHQDIEHSSLPDRQHYKCTWPGCERGFTKAGNLKVHIQNVHAKRKTFVCGTFDLSQSHKTAGWDGTGCGFASGTRANLEEHVRTQHLGIPAKLAPSRVRKLQEQGRSPCSSSSSMDMDEISTPNDNGHALTMLTGFGYEKARPVACLIGHCIQRFQNEYQLSQHLELTHGWQVDDIDDALAEREALSGGRFWIGAGEEMEAAAAEADTDEQLRMKLQNALLADNVVDGEPRDRSLTREEWEARQELGMPTTVSGIMDGVDMAIDPALSNA